MNKNIMPLRKRIKDILKNNNESTILVKRPWEINSESIILTQVFEKIPKPEENDGFEYFLEVFVAKDFISGYLNYLKENNVKQTEELLCQRLIQYALNDA